MKATQFWILLICSLVICALLLKEFLLSRTLYYQERNMGDAEEIAASGSSYEAAWKQLAIRIYEVGHQDPELMNVLKSENIGVHQAPPAVNATSPPSTAEPPGYPAPVPDHP